MNPRSTHYQVIARKYRPQTFASVVGQEAIVTTLKNALRFHRLGGAYLFCGCRGTGKTTLARLFAKALNCSQLTENFEPCNTCPSCLDIVSGRALDVLEIDGASNRGIDDIRQINETIGYAPSSGKYKIYIIDEVHMLTKEAFNALLKTLEEPPENVKFFFATTEPHKVLPTIISRCQRFDLNRIPIASLTQKLKAIADDLQTPCEDEVFSLIANLSEGSLRDAESLLDQILCYAESPITAHKVSETLGLLPHTAFFALDEAYSSQNLAFAFELADQVFASGKELSHFLDMLVDHYRRILKHKLTPAAHDLSPKQKEQITQAASHYTTEQCLYILDYLIEWQQQMNKMPFKRVTLEMILLHIIRSKHRVTLPSLVKKLNELATATPAARQEPIVASEEPQVLINKPAPTQEPIVASEEPQVLINKPAPTQEPIIASEEPQVLINKPAPAEEPIIASEEPQVLINKPAPTQEPIIASEEPQVLINKPAPAEEPIVASEEPQVLINKPAPVEEPIIASEEPQVLINKPAPTQELIIASEEPQVLINKPAPAEEPIIASEEPQVLINKPAPAEEPIIASEEPQVLINKPAPAEEPIVASEEPQVLMNQPTVPAEEPEASVPQTLTNESETLEETLLKKMRLKIESHVAPTFEMATELDLQEVQPEEIASAAPQTNSPPSPVENTTKIQARQETLMRFAAVELEGVIKKETSHG